MAAGYRSLLKMPWLEYFKALPVQAATRCRGQKGRVK